MKVIPLPGLLGTFYPSWPFPSKGAPKGNLTTSALHLPLRGVRSPVFPCHELGTEQFSFLCLSPYPHT